MDKTVKLSSIASLGSFVQWFDNTLFTVMLPLIIYNFVPKEVHLSQVFTLLIAYSATLFTRPFGAVIFAHFSDHFGRKKVLVITAFTMGTSMLFLGLCPPENIIGVAAPAFLLLFTFIHGFSSGGEWPNSATYLYEIGNQKSYARQGFILSLCMVLGLIVGNFLISLSVAVKPYYFIGEWSWRLLFIISALMAFITVGYRLTLPESPTRIKPHSKFSFFKAISQMKRPLCLSFMLSATDGVCFNLFLNTFYPFTDSLVNRAYEILGNLVALGASYFLYRLTKGLGNINTLKIALGSLVIIALGQLLLPQEISMGIYRLLYVLPTFLYLIPIAMLLPSLFEGGNRAFGVGFSRNISIFVFGGVGLIGMRWLLNPEAWMIAAYVIIIAIMSYSAVWVLSKKQKDLY